MARNKRNSPRQKRIGTSNRNVEKVSTINQKVYGEHWRNISYKAKQQIKMCCYCLIKNSEETHHVRYRKRISSKVTLLLLDDVVLGDDIYPVCLQCHDLLHLPKNWKTYKDSSYNHNTEAAIAVLKLGYTILINEVKAK